MRISDWSSDVCSSDLSRGIEASKAAFKPSINLNALVGLASAGLSELFSGDALLGFGGPAISLPIFDGGALRSQLAKADADYDLAVAGYNQTLVAALHEVTDAVQAARSPDAQIASATQAIGRAPWRERVVEYVEITVGAAKLKKKK